MRHHRIGYQMLAVLALVAATTACASGTSASTSSSSEPSASASAVPSSPGIRIQITLKPPHNYNWAPVASSAPGVVAVLDNQTSPDGTRSAVARAAAPGTATLSSADTYTPDPHGPPSRPWQLTVTVVP